MATLHPSNPFYKATQRVPQSRPDNAIDLLSPLNDDRHPASPPLHPLRSQSIATSTPSHPPSHPTLDRKTSVDYQPARKPPAFRTRSIGGPWGGVYFERDIDLSPPNDDEIIIATVRITDGFRRASVEENAVLPARPPRRGFLKRVSTRVSGPTDSCRYTALKMPRKDYKKFFARDREGNYAGTEPEREWAEEELRSMFERFQDMPLRSIPGHNEYGEGTRKENGGDEVARNDSVMAEGSIMDKELHRARSPENKSNQHDPTVAWPGSIWS